MSAHRITATERRCKVCGDIKPIGEFRRGQRLILRTCHDCYMEERRREYAADPTWAQRTVIHQQRTRRVNRERVRDYLRDHPCVDCGESDPIVLEFDHVRGEKVEGLATLIHRKSWAKVEAEIAKCEVRCACCHRRRTAFQFGWYRYLGRDHDADVREALDRIFGRQSLFPAADQERPAPPLLVTNVVGSLNEHLAVSPRELHIGEEVTILVRITGRSDGTAKAKSAVIIEPEELAS